jgi:hypothetical protein
MEEHAIDSLFLHQTAHTHVEGPDGGSPLGDVPRVQNGEVEWRRHHRGDASELCSRGGSKSLAQRFEERVRHEAPNVRAVRQCRDGRLSDGTWHSGEQAHVSTMGDDLQRGSAGHRNRHRRGQSPMCDHAIEPATFDQDTCMMHKACGREGAQGKGADTSDHAGPTEGPAGSWRDHLDVVAFVPSCSDLGKNEVSARITERFRVARCDDGDTQGCGVLSQKRHGGATKKDGTGPPQGARDGGAERDADEEQRFVAAKRADCAAFC